MKHSWLDPESREKIVGFVNYWSDRTSTSVSSILDKLEIPNSTFYSWRARGSAPNSPNHKTPKKHWLLPEEIKAIVDYAITHREVGYRRLTFEMIDKDVAYASPSTVYRILKIYDLLNKWDTSSTKKGTGFKQPKGPHQHWHTDISYLNINGTFYFLCAYLDGWSRYILHHEIRESMTTPDIETVFRRTLEKFPGVTPRLITDNGSQFTEREFRKYVREMGLQHVRTSPYYPQSNGKIERWHKSVKEECIRKKTPLTLEEARRYVRLYVKDYNNERLHGSIGYVTPRDRLMGNHTGIIKERIEKLERAQEMRRQIAEQKEIGLKLTA